MMAVERARGTMGTAALVMRWAWRARPCIGGVRRPAARAPADAAAGARVRRAAACARDAQGERFLDQAPAQVHATLLDEGHLSLLAADDVSPVGRRRRSKGASRSGPAPALRGAELLATRPNQVWSWDITKLLGPAKWTYFYLYVILDIFSRYVVGWMIAPHESAALAERLIAETCAKQEIAPGQLTLHADRGGAMRSKPVALLLADLGVVKTHSRPYVSNDNPFSEAQFRTLKYCPHFPERFGSIEDGRAFGQEFFRWYNQEHRHSGLGFLTPAVVHFGQADVVRAHRDRVLAAAYAAHPERFVNGRPHPADLPTAVWINAPVKKPTARMPQEATIAGPDDPQHGRIIEAPRRSTTAC
jgi:putative transposase